MSTCLCVGAHVCGCTRVYMYIWCLQQSFTFRQGLSLILEFANLSRPAGQQALRVSCLHLSITGFTDACFHTHLLHSFQGSNSGHHACPPGTLLYACYGTHTQIGELFLLCKIWGIKFQAWSQVPLPIEPSPLPTYNHFFNGKINSSSWEMLHTIITYSQPIVQFLPDQS